MQPDFYLVIDLEATCDDGGAVPRHEMEIIEIGAVLVEAAELTVVEEFQSFVTPVRHPQLTTFCTGLTSITQAMLDGAPGFHQAMDALGQFVAGRRARFGSWGAYDRRQLQQDASFHGVRLPKPLGPSHEHLNIKKAFSEQLGSRKKFGMASALRKVGIPLDGTHHRGLDDARNIAKLLPHALGRAHLRR